MKLMNEPEIKQVDLDSLESEFKAWLNTTEDEAAENASLKLELAFLRRQLEASQSAERFVNEKAHQFQLRINEMQAGILDKFDEGEENQKLKKWVQNLERNIVSLEKEKELVVKEAKETLETVRRSHDEELSDVKEECKRQLKGGVALLERRLKEKGAEVREMKHRLEMAEKSRHSEIVKVRLENDAKLLKLQQQQFVGIQRKHQEVRRDAEKNLVDELKKEIVELKETIVNLERRGHPKKGRFR
eukprot:m.89115 g.89115  ORF g.89115 m.89115 type:complete len:245 (+) comp36600_c0_seq3:329-1063(+)